MRCATISAVKFSVPESRRFPAPKKKDDSSVAGVASVSLLDGLAVFLVVMQAWPCRSVVKTMKNEKKSGTTTIICCSVPLQEMSSI